MSTRQEFAGALHDACESKDIDFDLSTERILGAFLRFGSHTEDNVACAETIVYGVSRDRDAGPPSKAGLLVSGTNYLISDIMAQLEDDPVFDFLQRRFPNLTRKQVEGALRMATMVLLAFERTAGKDAE